MFMQIRAAITFGLIFILAACADNVRKPNLTAPDVAPSFDLAGSGDMATLSSAVGVRRAATGARASGHAEVFRPAFQALYKYSFIALQTEPTLAAPAAAKGELQATIVRTTGPTTVTETIHADIDCAEFLDIPIPIFGRMVNMSGPIKKWTRDGQPVPYASGEEVLFTVQDNGEGNNATRPDRASAIVPDDGPQICRELFIGMGDTERGNIQVVFPGERGNNQP
jgi:hypothetical protein